MAEGKIFEGKTTQEAIDKGLKELKITKEQAEIRVLENEEKRSFFSILAPRVVKVEIISKKQERAQKTERVKKNREEIKNIDFEKAKKQVEDFLNDWIKTLPTSGITYQTKVEEGYLKIDLDGEDINYLIGHRGDTLNQLQIILACIASKNVEYKVKVILNISGYKQRREKSLEELAGKLEKTVVKTRRPITLEPMSAYERKVIHTKLQNSKKVVTSSVGEEPYRKVVISLK